jgi:lipopolysaccharide assembly protein A
MKWVTWTIRLVLLVLLVAFAAKNTDEVRLNFFFDVVLRAPLIVVLFCSFALGALFGILALLGTLLRQRREIARLKDKGGQGVTAPPI